MAAAKSILARVEAAELTLSEFGGLKRGTLAVQASQLRPSHQGAVSGVRRTRSHAVAAVLRRIKNAVELIGTGGITLQAAAMP